MRILILALALIGVCTSAQARTPESDRAAVVAVEQRWLAHISDPTALESILADDFTHPVAAGVVLSKRQHIDWARARPTPAGVTLSFETLDIRLYGDTAIATGITARRTGDDATLQRSIFTDVFEYRGGRWQAVNAQETAIAR